ncbi:hypothetical protein KM043_006304 [Ampulex compressa]|nr:hypothetical protein KM043_006304 [Ampulex compressa]
MPYDLLIHFHGKWQNGQIPNVIPARLCPRALADVCLSVGRENGRKSCGDERRAEVDGRISLAKGKLNLTERHSSNGPGQNRMTESDDRGRSAVNEGIKIPGDTNLDDASNADTLSTFGVGPKARRRSSKGARRSFGGSVERLAHNDTRYADTSAATDVERDTTMWPRLINDLIGYIYSRALLARAATANRNPASCARAIDVSRKK